MSTNDTRIRVTLEGQSGNEAVVNSDGSLSVNLVSGDVVLGTVSGTAADGAAASGNPVQVGGVDGSGNAQALLTDTSGNQQVVGTAASDSPVSGAPVRVGGRARTSAITAVTNDDAVDLIASPQGVIGTVHDLSGADGGSNTHGGFIDRNGTVVRGVGVYPHAHNGSTWDRARTVGVGNNVAATGIAASGAYGQYLNNANQPANTTGNYGNLQMEPVGCLRTAPQRPTASDITVGYLQHTSTTGAATLLTVGAGRTWVGTVTVSVAASKAATATGNGLVSALIATAGTNVSPAAATVFAVSTRIGANAATGTVGTQGSNFGSIPMTVTAPAGNSVTLTLASTLTNVTEGAVDACAFGVLQ